MDECSLAANRAVCLASLEDRGDADVLPQTDAAPVPPSIAPLPATDSAPMPPLTGVMAPPIDAIPSPGTQSPPLPPLGTAPLPSMQAPVPAVDQAPLPGVDAAPQPATDSAPMPPMQAPLPTAQDAAIATTAPEDNPVRAALRAHVDAYNAARAIVRSTPSDAEALKESELAGSRILEICTEAGYRSVGDCLAVNGLVLSDT